MNLVTCWVEWHCVSLHITIVGTLASCLIYAWALSADPYSMLLSIVWVCSFIEPDLFDNYVPLDNTTPIYLINLLWKLGLGLGLDLKVYYFSIFSRRITKSSTLYLLQISRKKRTDKRMHPNNQQQNKITYSMSGCE